MAEQQTPTLLDTTVAAGLQKIAVVVENFRKEYPNVSKAKELKNSKFHQQIKAVIQQILNEIPDGVEVKEICKKLSFALHPDKIIAKRCKVFTDETLKYLEDSALAHDFQKAIGEFKDYIPEKPLSIWKNPTNWLAHVSSFILKIWSLQSLVKTAKLPDHQGDVDEALQEIKFINKHFKKIAPEGAFAFSMLNGLYTYSRPFNYIVGFLSLVGDIPIIITGGGVAIGLKIALAFIHHVLQRPVNAFLNSLTGHKFNALMNEEIEKIKQAGLNRILENVIKELKKNSNLNGQNITLEKLKLMLSIPTEQLIAMQTSESIVILKCQQHINQQINNPIQELGNHLTQKRQDPIRIARLKFVAAAKSLTEKDKNTSKFFFFFSCLFRSPFLIALPAITSMLQSFEFIMEKATAMLFVTAIAIKVVSLFILNIPHFLSKPPKYLVNAWEKRAELANTFGHQLSEKVASLPIRLLLTFAAMGATAKICGLNPAILVILASVGVMLGFSSTPDDFIPSSELEQEEGLKWYLEGTAKNPKKIDVATHNLLEADHSDHAEAEKPLAKNTEDSNIPATIPEASGLGDAKAYTPSPMGNKGKRPADEQDEHAIQPRNTIKSTYLKKS